MIKKIITGLLVVLLLVVISVPVLLPSSEVLASPAFPQVEATNTSFEKDAAVQNHTVSLPAGIQAGETLLVFFACDGASGGVGWPGGWNEIFEAARGTDVTLAVAWRKATGGEGASITVTTVNSKRSAHASYRISGAIDPTSTAPEASTGATGDDANPNPDSLTAGGGSDEYLWIVVAGIDNRRTVTAYPTNYDSNQLYSLSDNALGCAIGVASDEVETDVQDPATFTISGGDQWVACTVAVYPLGPPTVTSQAATNVEDTTATGNGNITDIGAGNADRRGIVWDLATHGDPGNVAPGASGYANDVGTNGDFGVGAFTENLVGLPTGDTIYYRAYAHNSAGYSYGGEVNFLTKPAAPTNVAATDGAFTNKVVITWTKSTGATDYHVWRGAVDLGAAGDVATFDDVGADAGIITPGTASASDGTAETYVVLSLTGESTSDGTTHTYKVVASNATGDSDDSLTNTGYRGVGAITYQWQRSAADSDAAYGNIGGATTDPYNDVGAPANGDGRWYLCLVDATGAVQAESSHDRGFRLARYLVIYIDDIEEDSILLGGASVPDNANDWILNQNNVMPYMDYYYHTVAEVLHAWYQPNYMVEATDYDGTETAGGSAVIVTDNTMGEAPGYWVGALVTITEAGGVAPEGESRVCTVFAAGGVITVGVAFGANVDIGDDFTIDFGTLIDRSYYGLEFDTVDDIVACGADASMDITDEATLTAWVYIDSDGENNEGSIIDRRDAVPDGYRLYVSSEAAGNVAIEAILDGATDAYAVSNVDVSIGGWHYIVAVYNRLGTFHWEIYDDSVLLGLTTDQAGVAPITGHTANVMNIGDNAASNRCFDGRIDEPSFYTRAFAQAEVTSNYNVGLGTYTPTSSTNIALQLHMEEGTGVAVADTSGEANNGTITNAVWINGYVPRPAGNSGINDSRVTWGANPTGVAVTLGGMVSTGQPVPGVGVEAGAQDILPETEVSDWFIEPDVGGALLTNPLRPFVTMLSDNSTLTELLAWRLLALAAILMITVGTAIAVGRHQGITMMMAGGALLGAVVLTIYPMWALVFAIGMFIGGLVMERSPSL